MDFKEFIQRVVEDIPEYLMQYDIETIRTDKVLKNNDITLTGMAIKLKGEDIAPNIYLDYYYEQEPDMNLVLKRISQDYIQARQSMDMHISFTKESVISGLFMKAINREHNKQLLKDVVYEQYLDLALTIRYLVKSDETGVASIALKISDLETLGLTRTEVVQLAKENTRKLFPPVILRLDEALNQTMPGENFPETDLYILTNSQGMNGAVNIIYDDILEQFAQNKNSDFYILPSSIHEVLLLPKDTSMDEEYIQEMIRYINKEMVSEMDYLSDSLYLYDEREKHVSIEIDGNEKNIDEINHDLF